MKGKQVTCKIDPTLENCFEMGVGYQNNYVKIISLKYVFEHIVAGGPEIIWSKHCRVAWNIFLTLKNFIISGRLGGQNKF